MIYSLSDCNAQSVFHCSLLLFCVVPKTFVALCGLSQKKRFPRFSKLKGGLNFKCASADRILWLFIDLNGNCKKTFWCVCYSMFCDFNMIWVQARLMKSIFALLKQMWMGFILTCLKPKPMKLIAVYFYRIIYFLVYLWPLSHVCTYI